MKKIYYKAKGFVLGNLWGGGTGIYPSSPIASDTYEGIMDVAEEKLKEGSLDSGMGFDGLIGAILCITKYHIIEIEGKEYINKEYSDEYIGELTEDDEEYLTNCLYTHF